MKRAVFLFLLFATSLSAHAAAPKKPNLVVILADDLGYGDVQCNNPSRGKIPTPQIDRLAAGGMRFTDGHSSSGVCSPSRYTLLTGRYHWRSKLQSGIVGAFGKPLITPDRFTLANLAKSQGYRTGAIGKWHLGWDWPVTREQRGFLKSDEPTGPKDEEALHPNLEQKMVWRNVFSQPIPGGPTANGFDTYFGTDVPNWPPYCFMENDRTQGIPSEFLPSHLLKDHLAGEQGPALPGWDLEKILPTLGARAVQFVAEAAKSDAPYFLYLALTSPHTPLAVNSEWKGKSGLNAYADFVMETDALIGLVLDAIEESGEANDTFVVLTSDNGCAHYIGSVHLEKMGHYPSGALRGYKADAWEGGHRVPFLVRWPAAVKAGSVCGELVQQADLMATFADVLGVQLPENAGVDSFSLLPLLKGGKQPVRDNAVNCSKRGIPAIRQGPWKLILAAGSGGWTPGGDPSQPVQLYNLNEDLGETKNLAAEQPQRVAQMRQLWEGLIKNGRSTLGKAQANDGEVQRY